MGAALALPQPAKAGPDGRIGGSTDVGAAAAQSAEVSGPQFWNSDDRPQRPDPRSQASERARWPIPTHAPSFFSWRVGGRSDLLGRLLSASTRHPVLEDLGWGVATTGGSDFGVDLEAVGTRSFALGLGDYFAVFISELIELSLSPAGGDPGDEDGRDGAQRGVVVLALHDDESVVALGQRRVDVPSVICCEVKGVAQSGVTGLGDALVSRHQSGLVDLGHKAGEGAHAG